MGKAGKDEKEKDDDKEAAAGEGGLNKTPRDKDDHFGDMELTLAGPDDDMMYSQTKEPGAGGISMERDLEDDTPQVTSSQSRSKPSLVEESASHSHSKPHQFPKVVRLACGSVLTALLILQHRPAERGGRALSRAVETLQVLALLFSRECMD